MAARIPSAEALGPRSRVSPQRGIVTYRPVVAEGGGGGMQEVGRSLQRTADAGLVVAQEVRKDQLAEAHSVFTSGKIALESELSEDRDYGTLLDRYDQRLKSVRDDAAARIENPALRQQFTLAVAPERARGLSKFRARVAGLETDAALATLDDLLANNRQMALNTDDRADRQRLIEASGLAIAAAEENGHLSAERATNLRQQWTQSYAEAFVETRHPSERLELLDKGEGLVAVIPAERAKQLRDNAVAELQQGEREQNARVAATLEIAVGRGVAGAAEIEKAWGAGTLTPNQYVRLTKAADKYREDRSVESAQLGRVVTAMSLGLPLDPSSGDDRKAVDLHFERVFIPALGEVDPERQIESALGYVSQTGIVPSLVKRHWTSTLRGDNADMKAGTADAMARLNEMNPRLLENFDATDRRIALTIASNLRLGLPAAAAVKRAEDAVHNADDPARKVRLAKMKEEKLLDNAESVVADALAEPALFSLDFGDAAVSDGIVGEYRTLYEQHFLATGNADAAEALTVSDLKRTWAVTRVGGDRRLMKFAPERYGVPTMSDADNADWMQDQLEADLRELQLPSEDIRLEADPLTARQSPPSYLVFHENENGVFDVLMRNGRPLRWRPDWSTSPRLAEAEAERQEELDAARKARNKAVKAGETFYSDRKSARHGGR